MGLLGLRMGHMHGKSLDVSIVIPLLIFATNTHAETSPTSSTSSATRPKNPSSQPQHWAARSWATPTC